MSVDLGLSAVPIGTCARLGRPGGPRTLDDNYFASRYTRHVNRYFGVFRLYQALTGEPWPRWNGDATDRFHRALLGDHFLADTGGYRGEVRGTDSTLTSEAWLTLEEIATLGGPAAEVPDLVEWERELSQYLDFYRLLHPDEEVLYTQI